MLVDLVMLTGEHFPQTWIGIAFFLPHEPVDPPARAGARTIVILFSVILSWILNAAAVEHFFTSPCAAWPAAGGVEWHPKPGGGYYPKPAREPVHCARKEKEGGDGLGCELHV